jgi:hypothetical protein
MAGLHSSQHLESETGPRREPPVRRFSLKRSCSKKSLSGCARCRRLSGLAALLLLGGARPEPAGDRLLGRGEWWLAGDARPWQPDAVSVLSDKLVFRPRTPVAGCDLWHRVMGPPSDLWEPNFWPNWTPHHTSAVREDGDSSHPARRRFGKKP